MEEEDNTVVAQEVIIPMSNTNVIWSGDEEGVFDMTSSGSGPVTATIISTELHVVHVSFCVEGKELTAELCPGRMFVNGSRNLLGLTRTKQILAKLFKEGDVVQVMVQPLAKPRNVVFVKAGESKETVTFSKDDKTDSDKRLENKAEARSNREVSWGVVVLAVGDMPDLLELHNISFKYSSEDESFNKLINRAHMELLDTDNQTDEDEMGTWFLIHNCGPLASNLPVVGHYPSPVVATVSSWIKGVVKEIHRPAGGLVDVGTMNGGLITFHRSVVRDPQGKVIGLNDVLEDMMELGQQVIVDIVPNQMIDQNMLIHSASTSLIATALYLGSRPTADEESPSTDDKPKHSFSHKVKVVELTSCESGALIGGVATIQVSRLIRSGGAAASMVGEFVTFSSEDLLCYGYKMTGVDLSHLLGLGDELNCHLTMLDTVVGRAQYKVKLGWIDKVEVGKMALEFAPESHALHKQCDKLGLDFVNLERIITGKAGLKQSQVPGPTYAAGTVWDLDPAENNETVSKGVIRVEVGPHKGALIKFNRSKATLFGISLEKTDLLYVVRPNDQVFCEISGLADYPEGQYVSQQVQFFTPCEARSDIIITDMDQEERTQILYWLHIHHNTYKELKEALEGSSPNRYFIPFPRDQFAGRVICFDPVRSNKYGATSGTIVLEQGTLNVDNPQEGESGVKDMEGVRVTFHRSCFWVYGRKMAKADLSYVIQPNQKVMLECKKITEEDRKVHSALPKDIEYRATVIWIGPSRPRNDRADPNRNDTGIFQWLGKRGMNISQFTKLVEGRLPPHRPQELDRNNFFLPPVRGEGAIVSTSLVNTGAGGNTDQLPVLRHGPLIAHILDTAIASAGPADPRLMSLLENDEMAQAAHHVAEALRYSIQYYKEASQQAAYGRGYGASGPSRGGNKRSYDQSMDNYSAFGGGYSRPQPYKMQRNGRGGY